jgi:hypothetical protein
VSVIREVARLLLGRLRCRLGYHDLDHVTRLGRPEDFRSPWKPGSLFFYQQCHRCSWNDDPQAAVSRPAA